MRTKCVKAKFRCSDCQEIIEHTENLLNELENLRPIVGSGFHSFLQYECVVSVFFTCNTKTTTSGHEQFRARANVPGLLGGSLQAVGVDEVLALLVALDAALFASQSLSRQAPQEGAALVAVRGVSG